MGCYKLYVQCTTKTGKIGTFLASGDKDLFSPVFDDLAQLHQWAKEKGLIEPWQSLRTIPIR